MYPAVIAAASRSLREAMDLETAFTGTSGSTIDVEQYHKYDVRRTKVCVNGSNS
jgi:hypothetical protein